MEDRTMNFIRNLVFVIVIIGLIVGGVGYYRGWFGIATGTDDQKVNLNVTINKDRVKADEERAKQALENVGDKMKRKTEEVAGRGNEPGNPHKDIDARLKAFETKIDDLQARVARLDAPSKEALIRDIDSLNQKRRDISRKLEELKPAVGKAADELKAEIETDLKELQKAYDKVAARFE
jgi:DNA repair exonuclease SbcCD ATPase subunit